MQGPLIQGRVSLLSVNDEEMILILQWLIPQCIAMTYSEWELFAITSKCCTKARLLEIMLDFVCNYLDLSSFGGEVSRKKI